MAQNINNEHNSSRHVDFNTPMHTHNSQQPKTNCSMRAGKRVIEDAVEGVVHARVGQKLV